jgi:hypothetical protein
MLIDCDACAVRGPACGDCVVSVLLAGPAVQVHDGEPPGAQEAPATPELDAAERAAIAVLAGCGLVPPLRLVPFDGTDQGGAQRRAPVSEGEREVS